MLPLIEHYEINGILERCEEYLLKKSPDLRHAALAKEHNFKELEKRTISWASKQTLANLKQNPDWGIVEEKQRLKILEQMVLRYESQQKNSSARDSSSDSRAETTSTTAVRRSASLSSQPDRHRTQTSVECQNEKCVLYRDVVHAVKDITQGNVSQTGTGNVLLCNSMSHTRHYKGSLPNCVNCRSEMYVRIKSCLNKQFIGGGTS